MYSSCRKKEEAPYTDQVTSEVYGTIREGTEVYNTVCKRISQQRVCAMIKTAFSSRIRSGLGFTSIRVSRSGKAKMVKQNWYLLRIPY
jgi:hypothetical protein